MADAVKKYTGIDFNSISDDAKAREAAESIGVHVEKFDTWGKVLNTVFEEKVEENLVQPTFIIDYPVRFPPLQSGKSQTPSLPNALSFS
jgi:lysyl-tRNA synthetase class 2